MTCQYLEPGMALLILLVSRSSHPHNPVPPLCIAFTFICGGGLNLNARISLQTIVMEQKAGDGLVTSTEKAIN